MFDPLLKLVSLSLCSVFIAPDVDVSVLERVEFSSEVFLAEHTTHKLVNLLMQRREKLGTFVWMYWISQLTQT